MTDATITALRPSSTPPSPAPAGEGKPTRDVTAPLRARRYRAKRKAATAPPAEIRKPNEIKPRDTARVHHARRGTATRATRAMQRQAATAVGIGAVAVTLTALSLSHLAHGVALVTGAEKLGRRGAWRSGLTWASSPLNSVSLRP
jgi:hypothetical protein